MLCRFEEETDSEKPGKSALPVVKLFVHADLRSQSMIQIYQ
jgi:hypothetical protein